MCGDKPGCHISQCVKLTFFVCDELLVNAEEGPPRTPSAPRETLFWPIGWKCVRNKEKKQQLVMKTKDSKLHQLTIKIIRVGESVVDS